MIPEESVTHALWCAGRHTGQCRRGRAAGTERPQSIPNEAMEEVGDFFDRTVCPPPCNTMHSYSDGQRRDACAHEQVIPIEAVGAAVDVFERLVGIRDAYAVTAALEAAAPHLMAPILALADQWHAQGEDDMAVSKTIQDEHISTTLLAEGAAMVENARHIRNAIEGER